MSPRLFLLTMSFLVTISIAPVLFGQAAWTPPKTPWGDPDLQGMWPGNMGVPLQRPEKLGTRTTLTDEEFAQKEAQAKKQAQADSQSTSASDSVGIGPPSYWVERGKPTRQTSLIIDPPNGRLPPLTPEEQALRKTARGGKGFPGEWRGEANSYDDLNIYYRCITRGVLGSMIPVVYNNGNEILQAPGVVIIRNEMIHESSRYSARWAPAFELEYSPVHGRFARPLGRQHAGDRDHQLHR